MHINELLKEYPKTRPKLDDHLLEIYQDEYKKNRNGLTAITSVAQKLESWMHKKVARSNYSINPQKCTTLEIGAGTLNQLPYEAEGIDYDIVEPMTSLFQDSNLLYRVGNIYNNISDIPRSKKYSRIISIAVLEHLENLPLVIKESIRLMRDDGVFACGIPSEGGFLWGLAWRLTTGLEFRIRTGKDYGGLMRYEHLNNAKEIELLLRHFFKDIKVVRFGISRHFSLYTYIECRTPNKMN